MCTAIKLQLNNTYLCRSLDLEYNLNETVIITPRNYNIKYKYLDSNNNHYAIFGIGIIKNDFPLYYDACNEYGLYISGLNLYFSTSYNSYINNKINITSFEIILYLLSIYKSVNDIKNIINGLNITNDTFDNDLPISKLHFFISDKEQTIVLEIINGIINIYDNNVNVLTNEPPFPYQLQFLNNYYNLSNDDSNRVFKTSKGGHLIGLPGDNLSTSRFVKSYFTKNNIVINENNISEIFNMFNNVWEINGLTKVGENKYYKTIYISIYDINNLILYFKTYNNSNIYGVSLNSHLISDNKLISHSIYNKENILFI